MRTKLCIALLLCAVTIQAQDFYGKATYKSARKVNFKMDSTKANDAMQQQIQERLKKMYQKTYTLNFSKSESTYKENEKLNSPAAQSGQRVVVMNFGGGGGSEVMYKNIKENRMANSKDLMGKLFLIKDELEKYDWKMTGETKNIGQYTCYQAIHEREVENVNISMVNGESKEVKKKEIQKIVAWYTPDIPINNGPASYWGLPGLILEINDGKLTIACTEVVLNPSDRVAIEEPSKGKVVTREKFGKISEEKSKEFMDRYRSRDGKGFTIEIGG